MPKVIELTIEIEIQKVSCPGVWLCQDGRVSLTVFALGTSYQTCLLPPVFPLTFKDVFYFRKIYRESCALNNICCLLKNETIYCELVQWSEDCEKGECVILAQYLGSLNDVLFPPSMCSTEGVDLLMRRSKDFPGILSPKIEIATKVRIDEVWSQACNINNAAKVKACHCSPRPDVDVSRQKQVCHSAQYHRNKCSKSKRSSRSRSRSRSRSGGPNSCRSFEQNDDVLFSCRCPNPMSKSRALLFPKSPPSKGGPRQYTVCPVDVDNSWNEKSSQDSSYSDVERINEQVAINPETNEEQLHKHLLESRFIDQENYKYSSDICCPRLKSYSMKVMPCVCEICKRYHEIFHSNDKAS